MTKINKQELIDIIKNNNVKQLIKYHQKNMPLDIKFSIFETFDDIPKIIHISWKSKDILNSQNPMIINGIGNMKNINPEYDLQISDDNDIEEYIINHISSEDYENIKNKHIVEKVDLWRLLKMYYEGGIYVDIDRYCNIPFKDIIKPNAKCILPTHKDNNFSQDIMISCKSNPIHFNAIKMNLNRRKLNPNSEIYYLGPKTYFNAVTLTLYGKMYDEGRVDTVLFSYLRKQLDNSKYFQTFREEDGGCHGFHRTLIYDHGLSTYKPGNGLSKKAFYDEYKIKFWGDN